MLADCHIPILSNDMKIAFPKNKLGVKFCTESLDPSKKRRNFQIFLISVLLDIFQEKVKIFHTDKNTVQNDTTKTLRVIWPVFDII